MSEMTRRKFLAATSAAGVAIGLANSRLVSAADALVSPAAIFPSPALPYQEAALEPVISARTVGFHYKKHHLGALKGLNDALLLPEYKAYANKSIEEIMLLSANKSELSKLFNGAASAINHEFYWASMMPNGGDNAKPSGKLLTLLEASFGDIPNFKNKFRDIGVAHVGSGYVWLVENQGKLEIMSLNNLDNPKMRGLKPLLTVDIYEHAYYLDYQNLRKDYLQAVLDKLLNWNMAAARLEA